MFSSLLGCGEIPRTQ